MKRFLVALTVLVVCAAAARADEKLTLRWHGQSFFDLTTSKGTRIVFDPHAIEAYGRQNVSADLVLLSHFHTDHTRIEVIDNVKKAKILTGLKDLKGDGKQVEWNAIDETFKDVKIRTVGSYHDSTGGMQRGKNGIFVVEVDGLKIAHLGDLGHELSAAQVKKIGPVDVLLIPVGGVYTINGSDAKKVVEQLKPKRFIIPMHYGTKVYDDLLSAEEFLDDNEDGTVEQFKTNELVLDASKPAPKKPVIAVLHWNKDGK
jgi:L-ascorbate metabolism protein UlaG (beta-lactamase superfamily)